MNCKYQIRRLSLWALLSVVPLITGHVPCREPGHYAYEAVIRDNGSYGA